MTKEEPLRKSSHKLLLVILKFIPFITAVCYATNTLCSYLGIDTAVLSMVGGMSLSTWLFIWIATYVFRFCFYHRMFLYYILVSDMVSVYDFYFGIPVGDVDMILIQFVIALVFMFIILYCYAKCHKKTTIENAR